MTEFETGMAIGALIGVCSGVAGTVLVAMFHVAKQAADAVRKVSSKTLPAIAVAIMVAGCGSTVVTKVEVRERVDTLLVKGDTIRVVDVRSDTVYVDTVKSNGQVIGFRSVRAALDTTLQGVRMYLQYAYPPDRWAANIIGRDTVIRWTVRDSLIYKPYPVERVPLWVYIALGGMALALVALIVRR